MLECLRKVSGLIYCIHPFVTVSDPNCHLCDLVGPSSGCRNFQTLKKLTEVWSISIQVSAAHYYNIIQLYPIDQLKQNRTKYNQRTKNIDTSKIGQFTWLAHYFDVNIQGLQTKTLLSLHKRSRLAADPNRVAMNMFSEWKQVGNVAHSAELPKI